MMLYAMLMICWSANACSVLHSEHGFTDRADCVAWIGLTPRQLAEQRAELLAACKLVWNKVLTEYHSPDSYVRQQVEAAIANAERQP